MNKNKSEFSRRGFLTTAATVAAGASLVGISPSLTRAEEKEKEKKSGKIITRTLGKTGMVLPIVNMGVMNATNPEIVAAAYDMGVRHFDTAELYAYGANETMVGKVVKKMGIRDKINIATKVFHKSRRNKYSSAKLKQGLIDTVDESLKRLQTDYVDILYIHSISPDELEDINSPELKEGLTALKQSGKIRAAGISTHNRMSTVIRDVTAKGFYDVILTAINPAIGSSSDLLASMKEASDAGIGIVAMKTQAGGDRLPNQKALADFSSKTINIASLKWVMNHDFIHTSIPGFTNYEHLKQDFSVASNLEYTDDEKKLLESNDIELGMGYCHQCSKCLASCPNDADIPTLMRIHMYAAQYGNLRHARQTYNEIPHKNGLSNCTKCSECVATCLNSVDIPYNIEDLKAMYV